MGAYTIRALGPDTWHAFAALAEKHHGVWGGCWCTWFHGECAEKGTGAAGNRPNANEAPGGASASSHSVVAGDKPLV